MVKSDCSFDDSSDDEPLVKKKSTLNRQSEENVVRDNHSSGASDSDNDVIKDKKNKKSTNSSFVVSSLSSSHSSSESDFSYDIVPKTKVLKKKKTKEVFENDSDSDSNEPLSKSVGVNDSTDDSDVPLSESVRKKGTSQIRGKRKTISDNSANDDQEETSKPVSKKSRIDEKKDSENIDHKSLEKEKSKVNSDITRSSDGNDTDSDDAPLLKTKGKSLKAQIETNEREINEKKLRKNSDSSEGSEDKSDNSDSDVDVIKKEKLQKDSKTSILTKSSKEKSEDSDIEIKEIPMKAKTQKEDSAKLKSLKKHLKLCGYRVNNYRSLFDGCRSMKSKEQKLSSLLEELGVEGRPTIKKCKKVKRKREEEADVAELDLSNVITSENSRTRSSRSSNNHRIDKRNESSNPGKRKYDFSGLLDCIDTEGFPDQDNDSGKESNTKMKQRKRFVSSSSEEETSTDEKESFLDGKNLDMSPRVIIERVPSRELKFL